MPTKKELQEYIDKLQIKNEILKEMLVECYGQKNEQIQKAYH